MSGVKWFFCRYIISTLFPVIYFVNRILFTCLPDLVDQPMQNDPTFKHAAIQCELLVTSCECGIKYDGTLHSNQRAKSTSMSFKDIYDIIGPTSATKMKCIPTRVTNRSDESDNDYITYHNRRKHTKRF